MSGPRRSFVARLSYCASAARHREMSLKTIKALLLLRELSLEGSHSCFQLIILLHNFLEAF